MRIFLRCEIHIAVMSSPAMNIESFSRRRQRTHSADVLQPYQAYATSTVKSTNPKILNKFVEN